MRRFKCDKNVQRQRKSNKVVYSINSRVSICVFDYAIPPSNQISLRADLSLHGRRHSPTVRTPDAVCYHCYAHENSLWHWCSMQHTWAAWSNILSHIFESPWWRLSDDLGHRKLTANWRHTRRNAGIWFDTGWRHWNHENPRRIRRRRLIQCGLMGMYFISVCSHTSTLGLCIHTIYSTNLYLFIDIYMDIHLDIKISWGGFVNVRRSYAIECNTEPLEHEVLYARVLGLNHSRAPYNFGIFLWHSRINIFHPSVVSRRSFLEEWRVIFHPSVVSRRSFLEEWRVIFLREVYDGFRWISALRVPLQIVTINYYIIYVPEMSWSRTAVTNLLLFTSLIHRVRQSGIVLEYRQVRPLLRRGGSRAGSCIVS